MKKRFISRVTRVGSGLGIILPAAFVRQLEIMRGEYLELRVSGFALFYASRVPNPPPTPPREEKK